MAPSGQSSVRGRYKQEALEEEVDTHGFVAAIEELVGRYAELDEARRLGRRAPPPRPASEGESSPRTVA